MTERAPSFRRVARFIKGYDVDEVDTFVTRVLETLDDASPSRRRVTAVEARKVEFRHRFGGYDPDAVDWALDDWATRLPE